jgi:hypothetical protein
MQGLQAVVSRLMPARDRVAVLLDFLGQQTIVEVDREQLIVDSKNRPWRSWEYGRRGPSQTSIAVA